MYAVNLKFLDRVVNIQGIRLNKFRMHICKKQTKTGEFKRNSPFVRKFHRIRSGQGLYTAHKYKTNLGKWQDGICVVELEHILMSCMLNYTFTDKLL